MYRKNTIKAFYNSINGFLFIVIKRDGIIRMRKYNNNNT